jgi:sodium/bile acid cotransporter 7
MTERRASSAGLRAYRPDNFSLLLVATVILATVLPARGEFVGITDFVGWCGIVLLFFLHGATLSPSAIVAGFAQWRMQLVVLLSTFVLFPVVGLLFGLASGTLIAPSLYIGILFLCCLPSTVQSSIAFTSIARGNVPAAVCAATASNLLGIVITPALTGILLSRESVVSWGELDTIVGTLLVPFGVGQLLHSRIGGWVAARRSSLSMVDRGSVLIMVYAAFGKAVTGGLWHTISIGELAIVIVVCLTILGIVMTTMLAVSKLLQFDEADTAAVLFCGSKKSLITGIPMASVLFPASTVGAIVLPLMTFHQLQLIVCAFVAGRLQRRHTHRSGGEVTEGLEAS